MRLTGRVSSIIFRRATALTTTPSLSVLLLTDPTRPGVGIRAVGPAPLLQVGMVLNLQGDFECHPTYGRQFAFTDGQAVSPQTIEGFTDRLSGPLFAGLGPARIASLRVHLGPRVIGLLSNAHTPEGLSKATQALETVPGFGPRLRTQLITTWMTAYPRWEAPAPALMPAPAAQGHQEAPYVVSIPPHARDVSPTVVRQS